MKLDILKEDLKEIIHSKIYKSTQMSDDLKNKYNSIVDYLTNSENLIDDLDNISSIRSNDNYFEYDKTIMQIIMKCNDKKKIEILANSISFKNELDNQSTAIVLWDSISNTEKTNYLLNKKQLSGIDITFINNEFKKSSKIESILLKEIINNDGFRNKIDKYSIELSSSKFTNKIDLCDYELCSVFTKLSYTNAILKKCKSFDSFLDLYNKENKIINLIENGLLIFKSNDNEKIYNFLLDNPNLLGKFNEKYLDLFSIVEINNFSKIKKLDGSAYSAVISKLFKYDKMNYAKLFTPSSLEKCDKCTLNVYPFDEISDDTKKVILSDKNLLNKFFDVVKIEAIINNYEEDEVLNILRDDSFVDNISSYALELLLNKLSFRSAFNMLQRKHILEKIKYLNVKIDASELIFVKGFLDSPSLVNKSDSNMLYEMLLLLDKEDVMYYLALPYVINVLTVYEVINLGIRMNISLKDFFKSNLITEKFNVVDMIEFINKSWEKNLDLTIFEDINILKKILGINDKTIENINVNEVNYLFETIRMKSLLSKQDVVCDVSSYKSVLSGYLVLGLDKMLELVNIGNSNVTLDELCIIKKDVVNKRINNLKIQKELFFKGIDNNVITELKKISANNIDEFVNKVQDNSYLNSLLYLMIWHKYDSFNNIINKMYSFICYKHESNSIIEMKNYIIGFINYYYESMYNEYSNDFDKIIKNNFKLKDSVVYRDRKKKGKEFFNKVKLNLFIKALSNTENDWYNYLKDNYTSEELKNNYIKYLKNDNHSFEDILDHILIPLNNNRFDVTNCLNQLGIKKPDAYDKYRIQQNNLKNITKINIKLDKYKEKFSKEELLSILNYICYGNELPFKVNKMVLKQLNGFKNTIYDIDSEIYIDKTTDKLIYSYIDDVYNIDEIIEYTKYVEIIESIIKKTNLFINKVFSDNKIIAGYNKEYLNYISDISKDYPINEDNYELKKRVLSLNDIKKTFDGYDINLDKKVSLAMFSFLNKYLIYYLDGYLDGLINNFGMVISNFDRISGITKGTLSILNVIDYLSKCNYNSNKYLKVIDKDIINSVNTDSSYIITDKNERLSMVADLFVQSLKKNNSSIPFVNYIEDDYEIKIIDNYNIDAYKPMPNSIYKVGMIGGDLLAYSLLSCDGCQIGIYKSGKLINKAIAVRNGNTLFINTMEGKRNKDIIHLLKKLGNKIITSTEKRSEPIEFVTIVNNDLYNDAAGCVIDRTVCPIINYPIFTDSPDFKEFINTKYVLRKRDNIYTNFEDNYATLVANSLVVDKNNYKYYDATNCYLRKRNDVIKLSKNLDENYYNKICLIMSLSNNKNTGLDKFDTIYLGDDFVIVVYGKSTIVYNLEYDVRAIQEIDTILDIIKKKEQ